MDMLDKASEVEASQRKMALSRHFQSNQIKLVASATHCIECGCDIPEARRIASQGCQYCIDCQSLAEQGKL